MASHVTGSGPPRESQPSTSCGVSDSTLSCWDELVASLDAVKSLDNFSNTNAYSVAANPVIHVGDNLLVSLPLTDHGAEMIKGACKQVAAKAGGQIAVDTKVSWRLSSDQFRLTNPAWPAFLNTIRESVCADLGFLGPVDTQLHELILCEKGSLPWPHNEKRECEGLVATLAIYLPSEHEGGKVRFLCAGKDYEIDIAKSSLFKTKALAWGRNATHAVEDIVSGYRLILVYNIVDQSPLRDSPANFDLQIEIVRQALCRCIKESSNLSMKVYFLAKNYSSKGLGRRSLKGHDHAAFETLKKLSHEHGLYILLGQVREKHTTLGDLNTGHDTMETIFSVDLFDGDAGARIAKNELFIESQILNIRCRKNQIVTQSSKPTTPSNDKPMEIITYCNTAVILCAKTHLGSYSHSTSNVLFRPMIHMVMNELDDSSTAHKATGVSLKALEEIIESWQSQNVDRDFYSTVIQWAWGKQYMNLFIKLVSSAIMRGIDIEAMNTVARIIDNDALEAPNPNSIRWGKYFDGAISQHQELQTIDLNLAIVENKIRDNLKHSFHTWRRAVEQQVFRVKTEIKFDDILYFFHSIVPVTEHFEWVINYLIPVLGSTNPQILRESVRQILDEGKNANLKNAYEIADKVMLCTYPSASLQTIDFQSEPYLSSPAKCFINLLDACLRAGLKQGVARLLDTSWINIALCHATADSLPLMPWKDNVVGFLHDLGSLLRNHNFPYISSTREMFKLLIRRYLYSVAPSYPENRPGWSRQPRGCGCQICGELDKFLQAEDLVKMTFRREHVEHIRSRLPDRIFRSMPSHVVHKIKGREFKSNLESYYKDLLQFESSLEPLRLDYMNQLLGEADYRELIMLEKIRDSKGGKILSDADDSATGRKRAGDSNGADNNKRAKIKATKEE